MMTRILCIALAVFGLASQSFALSIPFQTDKTAFTEGSGGVQVQGGCFNATRGGDISEDNVGCIRVTAKGDQQVTIVGSTGTNLTDGTANAVKVLSVDSTGSAITASTIATEAATFATGATNVLESLGFTYGYDGSTWARLGQFTGVEDAAETAGGYLSRMGSVRRDTAASSAGTSGDNATVNTDSLGRLWAREGDPCADFDRLTSAAISESTAATNEIVALTASNKILVCNYKVVTTAATSLKWQYGTGTDCATGTTDIEGAQPYAANSGIHESGGGHALFIVPAGNALCLSSSAATAHGGRITYVKTTAP